MRVPRSSSAPNRSCLLSPVSCLLDTVSCLLDTVSCLLERAECPPTDRHPTEAGRIRQRNWYQLESTARPQRHRRRLAAWRSSVPGLIPLCPCYPNARPALPAWMRSPTVGCRRGVRRSSAGGAGCGKTLLALEFLVRGAMDFNEPGVFVAFEERAEELAANVASLGFDLSALEAHGKLTLDHIHFERNEIEETGEYDLDGLFLRLGYAIDSIKGSDHAYRVMIEAMEEGAVTLGADGTILFCNRRFASMLRLPGAIPHLGRSNTFCRPGAGMPSRRCAQRRGLAGGRWHAGARLPRLQCAAGR
jgi:PAS domain-containing protein